MAIHRISAEFGVSNIFTNKNRITFLDKAKELLEKKEKELPELSSSVAKQRWVLIKAKKANALKIENEDKLFTDMLIAKKQYVDIFRRRKFLKADILDLKIFIRETEELIEQNGK